MTCRRTPDGPMLPTHRHDCDNAGCPGCTPCPEHHCTARDRCGRHVAPTELTCGECIGKTRRDIAQIVELSAGTRSHPTEKPIALMAALVRKTRGVVADPFAGSGTTLRAAKDEGRRAIGVELEERYCEIAARRLTQDVLDFEGAS